MFKRHSNCTLGVFALAILAFAASASSLSGAKLEPEAELVTSSGAPNGDCAFGFVGGASLSDGEPLFTHFQTFCRSTLGGPLRIDAVWMGDIGIRCRADGAPGPCSGDGASFHFGKLYGGERSYRVDLRATLVGKAGDVAVGRLLLCRSSRNEIILDNNDCIALAAFRADSRNRVNISTIVTIGSVGGLQTAQNWALKFQLDSLNIGASIRMEHFAVNSPSPNSISSLVRVCADAGAGVPRGMGIAFQVHQFSFWSSPSPMAVPLIVPVGGCSHDVTVPAGTIVVAQQVPRAPFVRAAYYGETSYLNRFGGNLADGVLLGRIDGDLSPLSWGFVYKSLGKQACPGNVLRTHLTPFILLMEPLQWSYWSGGLDYLLGLLGEPNDLEAKMFLLHSGATAFVNALHPDIQFPLSVLEVWETVSRAVRSGNTEVMLEAANRLAVSNSAKEGCPLTPVF